MSPAEHATAKITSILNKYADQMDLLDIIDIVDSLRLIMEKICEKE